MKIAIATDWFAPRVGGIESQLAQLADGLGRRGHQVDVITSTPRASSGAHYRVRQLDVARMPGLDVAVSPRLGSALREVLGAGYDVVHAHVSVVSPVAYIAALSARRLGLATVVTLHSVLRAKRLFLRASNALANLASGIVWTAVSRHVAKDAGEALRADVVVLPNGVDLGAWACSKERRRTNRELVTLVSTMRLNRKKRPLSLLRAFADAARHARTRMRLIIVGAGPQAGAVHRGMRDLFETGTCQDLELRSLLSPAELCELYHRSDGFVLASRRESFGIAALEARAAGLPVIGLRESGINEFVNHDVDGLLARDDAELAVLMARFADDAALRESLSRQPALARFDWSEVLARHEAVYRRAMQVAPAPAGPVAASA